MEFVSLLKRLLKKNDGLFISVLTIMFYIVIFALSLYLRLADKINNIDFLWTIFLLLISYLPIHMYLIQKRNQVNLICCTSKYLLLADESKIDDLLGMMQGGKWDQLKLDPINEFFTCLKKILLKSDYEMRRRVAETLPVLFSIDVEESQKLTDILRRDWDDKWKSDNRRRTIESLSYIVKKNKNIVRKNLKVFEGDEIYTIIAIIEIICIWGDDNSTAGYADREDMFNNVIEQMKLFGHDNRHIEAISTLWGMFKLMHSDLSGALERFNELKDDPNIYIQIGIARNLGSFCKQFPDGCIKLMATFIEADRHKYVRRPIAKENNVEQLIDLLHNRQHSDKARDVLWNLINDTDSIIRITAFDKIEKILQVDKEFAHKLIDQVIEMNLDTKTVRRATSLMERLRDS